MCQNKISNNFFMTNSLFQNRILNFVCLSNAMEKFFGWNRRTKAFSCFHWKVFFIKMLHLYTSRLLLYVLRLHCRYFKILDRYSEGPKIRSKMCSKHTLWQVKLQFWYQFVAQLCLLPRSCMKKQEIGISTDKTNWAIQNVEVQNDSNDVQRVLMLHQKLAH